MATPRYVKHEHIDLKRSPDFNERWLHELIAHDPTMLGLGEVELVATEKRQHHAGRLDMLLSDPDDETRYEVELMLGPTDESHIIRCIEYWDNERTRFPNREHVAVLVAEDITNRFLNVIRLLARSVPIIAIQLSALKVGDQVALNFVRVVNHSPVPDDDEEAASPPSDRDYWTRRVGAKQLELVDAIAAMVSAATGRAGGERYEVKYLKYHVGLSASGDSFNLVSFAPKKQFVRVRFRPADEGAWFDRFKQAGVDASRKPNRLTLTLTAKDLEANRPLLEELVKVVVAERAE